jgi:hypothetical protein
MLQFTNTYNIYGFQESFDKVNRNILFEILKNNQVQNQLIKAIYNIHKMNFIAVKVGIEYSEWKSVNQGVHQDSKIYTSIIYNKYERHDQKRGTYIMQHNNHRNVDLDTLLFADNQIIQANSEDELQHPLHNLQNTAKEFNKEIATIKTKIMAFQGKDPIHSKICIYDKVTEQGNCFKYLGYYSNTTNENEKDISE